MSTLSWQFYFSVLNFPFASSLATSLLRLPFFPFASKVFVLIYWIIFIMPVLKALIIPTFVSSRYHCLLNVISLQVEVFLVLCLLIKYTLYHGHSPGREAALAWASLAQRFPASSILARAGAGCGSVGDVPGAWLASAPLSPSLWT